MPRAKLFAEGQGLGLVVRVESCAVLHRGHCHGLFQAKTAKALVVIDEERHIVRAYFEDGFGAVSAGSVDAKARIEEAGIVHAELTHQRVEGHHFRCMIGNVHRLPGATIAQLRDERSTIAVAAARISTRPSRRLGDATG